MLALGEPGRIYVDKPQGTRVQRQISRMIKHLRDQYHDKYPLHAMPSSWLIEQLVINAAKSSIIYCDDWRQRVRLTIKQIILDTSYNECLYVNCNNNLPLFPNNELFDPWEVKQAMKALLEFLDDEV